MSWPRSEVNRPTDCRAAHRPRARNAERIDRQLQDSSRHNTGTWSTAAADGVAETETVRPSAPGQQRHVPSSSRQQKQGELERPNTWPAAPQQRRAPGIPTSAFCILHRPSPRLRAEQRCACTVYNVCLRSSHGRGWRGAGDGAVRQQRRVCVAHACFAPRASSFDEPRDIRPQACPKRAACAVQ